MREWSRLIGAAGLGGLMALGAGVTAQDVIVDRIALRTPLAPQYGGVPSNGILFTTDAACPDGYAVYTALRGRYVVGLPENGTSAGTAGTALTDQENRAVGDHTHTFTGTAHTHTFTGSNHNHSFSGSQSHGHTNSVSSQHTHTYNQRDPGTGRTASAGTATTGLKNHPTGVTSMTSGGQSVGTTVTVNNTTVSISGTSGNRTAGGTVNNTTASGTTGNTTASGTTGNTTASGTTGDAGSVDGTPAPYVQLLACQRS